MCLQDVRRWRRTDCKVSINLAEFFRSRTGTGKTLAFLLPLEELVLRNQEAGNSKGVQAIILEPTRELAS